MANADSFTNQKTGNKIDLVDSGAREQIEELNETLTELGGFINVQQISDIIDALSSFAIGTTRQIIIDTSLTTEITNGIVNAMGRGYATRSNTNIYDVQFWAGSQSNLFTFRITDGAYANVFRIQGTAIS